MSETTFTRTNRGRRWQIATFFFLLISISLLIALIVVATDKDSKDEQPTQRAQGPSVCGQGGSNPSGNTIDLSTPTNPGPFHDLTEEELKNLRQFLENDPQIQATPWSNFQGLPSSYIYMADLWLPPKADVLNFLDNGGQQPQRQARVMMFRGDKNPPVVEEWICGPLPEITKCEMLSYPNRRNPVEFEVR
ncbi:amine oxidase [Plakobranchus ocellatus]|uniref:Amine oxidase n=1 Tax=Plakobranchus ocellatus TaxID=259542 RepID=A0AAV3YTQ9_9GAST|nr:amine oxidase [Plakobranchus ocellatus]